jgi:hypothetical protein
MYQPSLIRNRSFLKYAFGPDDQTLAWALFHTQQLMPAVKKYVGFKDVPQVRGSPRGKSAMALPLLSL